MNVAFDDHDPHENPGSWTGLGFTVGEARRWIDTGFDPRSALRWREHGVYRPDRALAWRTAGLTPRTVDLPLRAGMTPEEAVRWRELGYDRADAAERHLSGERPRPRRALSRLLSRPHDRDLELDDEQAETMHALLAAGVTPARARAYLDAGWRGARAVPWARAGVEATQAVLYRCLGLFPEEAARLAEAGTDAEQLLCAWWDAGIPRAEAASWLIARTSPEDAARAEAARNGDRPE